MTLCCPNQREIAAVIAGLRALQVAEYGPIGIKIPTGEWEAILDIGSNGGEFDALGHAEIDALCERINTGAGDEVWVLSIDHRDGLTTYACDSEEALRRVLELWVIAYWGEELPGEPMPDDVDEAIEMYFERAWDRLESYISERVVITTVANARQGFRWSERVKDHLRAANEPTAGTGAAAESESSKARLRKSDHPSEREWVVSAEGRPLRKVFVYPPDPQFDREVTMYGRQDGHWKHVGERYAVDEALAWLRSTGVPGHELDPLIAQLRELRWKVNGDADRRDCGVG